MWGEGPKSVTSETTTACARAAWDSFAAARSVPDSRAPAPAVTQRQAPLEGNPMKITSFACLAALLVSAPSFADGVPAPGDVEAAFDAARLKDDCFGSTTDTAKQVRVLFHASAGSKLTATLAPGAEGTPATGLSLTLCDAAGVDQGIGGSAYDKSEEGSGVVTWKKAPIAATSDYALIVRAAGAGTWRLTLTSTLAAVKQTFESTETLAVNGQAEVQFEGLRGGTLAYALKTPEGSKFEGSLVRIERPDGSTIAGTPDTAKGKVALDADGLHRLVFANVGRGLGDWKATTNVTPPLLVKRTAYVRPAGTVFVPVVKKLAPASGFHRDDAAEVTLTGRDFQDGCDVRLIRNGFEDIIATNVRVDSETQVRVTLDLDTAPDTGVTSVGTWNVGVWNAPEYTVPADPKTLVKDSPTSNTKKTFNCLSAASITLPRGIAPESEVWQLVFNDEFQNDLNRMGLGSVDPTTQAYVREAVEAYVVCFLRELMRANETTGKIEAGTSVPVSFVVSKVPTPAGHAGEDYNRIEIGGGWVDGDPRDQSEPLFWGFAPLDTGNANREDLSVTVLDDLGGEVHAGLGVRTRVLDPSGANADPSWVTAMAPLRAAGLGFDDQKYFLPGFAPATQGQANRYRDIVNQVTRASREIAAIVAHHVGRAMGVAAGGNGPMANPNVAGNMWPVNGQLAFDQADANTLLANAVPHQLPGKSGGLEVNYFPLLSTQPAYLPNLTTAVAYSVNWNFVGGRANALPADYSVKYVQGNPPLDLQLSYQGLSGTARLYLNQSQGLFYCNISFFRIQVTDTVRRRASSFVYRLNILPNVPLLRPGVEQTNATNCRNAVLATP